MTNKVKIVVINGPNLNLLAERDPVKYGALSLEEIGKKLESAYPECEFIFYQSNIEGEIIEKLHEIRNSVQGLIINCGGFSHTSVAIHDALQLVNIPKIEVHLSHLATREEFRQKMLTAAACDGYLSGFKEKGYLAAAYLILQMLRTTND